MWNRTPSRAAELVAEGATLAATPTDAIAASELTILSLTDCQAMYDILGPVVEDPQQASVLAGKVLVNLSSDTPGDLSATLMMGATADHILRTSEKAGIDLELPKAVKSHYDRAIAAGQGTKNWTALFEVIKPAQLTAGRSETPLHDPRNTA